MEHIEHDLADVLWSEPALVQGSGGAQLGTARGIPRLVGADWEDHHLQAMGDGAPERSRSAVEEYE